MRSLSYMWHDFSHSPAMPLTAAIALIVIAMWMSRHPDNRDYTNAFQGPSLDKWAVEEAGMGARRLGFTRRIPSPAGERYYDREGVEIKVRPYWAYRVWPRTWRWMKIEYPYIGRELGSRSESGEYHGIRPGITASATFTREGRSLGPIELRGPYENEADTVNAADIRRVETFLRESEGAPLLIEVSFYEAGEVVLVRRISAPALATEYGFTSASLVDALNGGGWGLTTVMSPR